VNATQPTHPAEPKAKLAQGRHADGQFAPGNPGGPGNPLARKVAALRKALIETVTEEDVREIGKVLIQKAKEGSPAAIKLVFQYAIGKPGPETGPNRLDFDGWQSPNRAVGAQPGATAGKAAAPPGNFPAALVDRLAMTGLGTAQAPFLVAGPSPNGENGARSGEGKEMPPSP
jgi:hypothetical protein